MLPRAELYPNKSLLRAKEELTMYTSVYRSLSSLPIMLLSALFLSPIALGVSAGQEKKPEAQAPRQEATPAKPQPSPQSSPEEVKKPEEKKPDEYRQTTLKGRLHH